MEQYIQCWKAMPKATAFITAITTYFFYLTGSIFYGLV